MIRDKAIEIQRAQQSAIGVSEEKLKAVKLERDQFKKSADAQSVLAIDLRDNLDAKLERNGQLEAQVNYLEKKKVALLEFEAATLVECKNIVNTCLYLLWKFNRDADFFVSSS